MATVYEGMFLLDNQSVREDWKQAKSLVTGTIEKHGGKVLTARRWEERRLAYPIKGKKRATYLLTYYELPGDAMPATRRDFDLSENVLRYLWLAVDEIPEEERALSEAENADDFTIPEPPEDDAVEEEEAPAEEPTGSGRGDRAEARGGDGADEKPDAEGTAKAEKSEKAEKAEKPEKGGESAPAPAESGTGTGTGTGTSEKAEAKQDDAQEASKEN